MSIPAKTTCELQNKHQCVPYTSYSKHTEHNYSISQHHHDKLCQAIVKTTFLA